MHDCRVSVAVKNTGMSLLSVHQIASHLTALLILCALQAEHELLSTTSSKNSEQLDSHDLRIMALEKTSYSGTFIWKISGFQNALEAAVKNEKVLLAFPVCE